MSSSHRYPEGQAQCAEILRIALPQMTRQAAGPHPISYAVWFEHASGRNPRLAQAIAAMTRDGGVLDDDKTWQLYRDHVADVDELTAARMAAGIREVVSDMSASAREAGAQTASFGNSLARFSNAVDHGTVPDPLLMQDVLKHSAVMRTAMDALQERLLASQQEIERLRSEVDRARTEARVDPLTGLPNRRAFEQAIDQLENRARACVLVTDIDHFKKVNDTYGHLFGDSVLRVVAQALRNCVQEGQLAARIGGEEFAILVPAQPATAVKDLAEKIRSTIAGSRIRRKDSQESIGQITVSLGVAERLPGESADSWLERADRALYASKMRGRNQVSLAEN